MATQPNSLVGLDDPILKAQLEAIKRQLEEERLKQSGAATGEAISRGLQGSTYEAARQGAADRAATQGIADASVNLAIKGAEQAREDRLISEERANQDKVRAEQFGYQKQIEEFRQKYDTLEQEKQRAFQAGEYDRARAFEDQQAALNRSAQAASDRLGLIGAGVQGGAGLLGQLFARRGAGMAPGAGGVLSKMFGVGGAGGVGGAPGIASAGGAVAPFMSGLAPIAGGAAAYGISSGLGQVLGKSIFKSDAATTASRKGAQIGALFPGGGLFGGVLGGFQPQVKKLAKKIFCFHPLTQVIMEDGSTKSIKDLCLGDQTKGGRVISYRISQSEESIYLYRGVKVTGEHAVYDNDEWKRVKDCMYSFPVGYGEIVISIVTGGNLIYVKAEGNTEIKFADEHETPFYESFNLEESLSYLNGNRTEALNG